MTITDETVAKLRKGVTDPLRALAAFKQAGKQQ